MSFFRNSWMSQEQIDRLAAEIKSLDRPLHVGDLTEIDNVKFRVVMDIHARERIDRSDKDGTLNVLYGDNVYTFSGGEGEIKEDQSAKSGHPLKKAAYLDLVAENCKLESIIEQCRMANDRMKSQLKEAEEGNGKSWLLVATVKDFFSELSIVDEKEETKLSKGTSNLKGLAGKISEAIDKKEAAYLKDCLKELSNIISTHQNQCKRLEKDLLITHRSLEQSKRNTEVIEAQNKELVQAAQTICDPDSDKPVNLYQLKMQLRNKLKALDDHSEIFTTEAFALKPYESRCNNQDSDQKHQTISNPSNQTPAEESEHHQKSQIHSASTQSKVDSDHKSSSHNSGNCQTHKTIQTATTPFMVTGRLHSKLSQNHDTHTGDTMQLRSTGVQAIFSDEEIFPPLDYRRCTRCGKNDAISPGVCQYKSRCVSHADGPNMISLKSRDRVEYSHSYKSEESDDKPTSGNMVLFKSRPVKSFAYRSTAGMQDQGSQTIVGIAEVRSMNRGPLRDYRHIDKILLSPKEHMA